MQEEESKQNGSHVSLSKDETDVITEDYLLWKKNTPLLYDLLLSYAKTWPCLTIEWLPHITTSPDTQDADIHQLVLGTNVSDSPTSHIQVVQLNLPKPAAPVHLSPFQNQTELFTPIHCVGLGYVPPNFSVLKRIPHEGEVNRLRHMPQSSNILASKTVSGEVHLFDIDKVDLISAQSPSTGKPIARLTGHQAEGFGLSWNPQNVGFLASAAYDSLVCVWDINSIFEKAPANSASPEINTEGEIKPLHTIQCQAKDVEDVSWQHKNGSILAVVGSDSKLAIYDIRTKSKQPASVTERAHKFGAVMAVDFNPFNPNILATAGKDGTAGLWDMRMIHCRFHGLDCYEADQEGENSDEENKEAKEKAEREMEVNSISWSNASESILATAGTDRRVRIWDLSRVGAQQSRIDEEDGPPQLLFIHGGHTAIVTDISWNKNQQLMMASASEDNLLQIWQMAGEMYFNNEYFEGDEAI